MRFRTSTAGFRPGNPPGNLTGAERTAVFSRHYRKNAEGTSEKKDDASRSAFHDMEGADFAVADGALHLERVGFQVGIRARAEPLPSQLGGDLRANGLDPVAFRFGRIVPRQERFEFAGAFRQLRQLAHRPEHPFVIRGEAAVQQKDHSGGVPHELVQRQGRRAGFAVFQAPGIVVLPALGHEDRPGGDLLPPDVLRHAVQDGPPDARENTQVVAEDRAVHGLGERVVRGIEPLTPVLWRAGKPQVPSVEIVDHGHAVLGISEHAAFRTRQRFCSC